MTTLTVPQFLSYAYCRVTVWFLFWQYVSIFREIYTFQSCRLYEDLRRWKKRKTSEFSYELYILEDKQSYSSKLLILTKKLFRILYVFVLLPLLFPYRGDKMRALTLIRVGLLGFLYGDRRLKLRPLKNYARNFIFGK